MKRVIVWKGIYYQSMEYCTIKIDDRQVEVISTILGIHEGKAYKVDYFILANSNWQMRDCRIDSRFGRACDVQLIHHDGRGNWINNGNPMKSFKGCIDIDISLSPLTNALPINRLQLQVHENRRIDVVYIDVLGGAVRYAAQQYARMSHNKYLYKNVPNDFEALVTVDEDGIVSDYPGLFVRVNG